MLSQRWVSYHTLRSNCSTSMIAMVFNKPMIDPQVQTITLQTKFVDFLSWRTGMHVEIHISKHFTRNPAVNVMPVRMCSDQQRPTKRQGCLTSWNRARACWMLPARNSSTPQACQMGTCQGSACDPFSSSSLALPTFPASASSSAHACATPKADHFHWSDN